LKKILNGYFTDTSFFIEEDQELEILYESFSSKYEGLFHLAFKEREHLSPALIFLYDLSVLFMRRLSQQADLEISREKIEVPLNEEDIALLLMELPLVLGSEHVCAEWIQIQWHALNQVFSELIYDYEGSVESYLKNLDENIHVADRIYFHLVEHKDSNAPFAFIATYSVASKQGAEHLPLMHAFDAFKEDQKS